MSFRPFHALVVLATCCSPAVALDSVEFIVGPNSITYGAMGEVRPDVRDVKITAEGNWWIANPGAQCIAKDNSDLQISQPMPLDPTCSKHQQPKAVKWEVTTTHTNHFMRLQVDGKLHYCDGDGNGGQPPPFASHVFHADIDVDSDNTNTDSTYANRAPDSPADSSAPDPKEDAIEDEVGKPGVVVLVNRGWEQSTDPGIAYDALITAQKTQDLVRADPTTVKVADPHLIKTRIVIKGLKDTGTLTLKAPPQLRIYDAEGKLFTSGEKTNGEFWFYLEGIAASAALGDARIEMTVTAAGVAGSVKDAVRCTVVDIEVDGLAEPVKGDDSAWGSATHRFAYSSKKSGVLTVMPRMTLKPPVPADLAETLLGGYNCALLVKEIDDSHGGDGAGKDHRVSVTWKPDRAIPTGSILWKDPKHYDPTKGTVRVFCRFTGLPKENSDFGDKWFEIRVAGAPYHRLPWRAFFQAQATNHDKEPAATANAKQSFNWYYYWSVNRGGSDPACHYSYDGQDPKVAFMEVPPVAGALGFVPNDNSLLFLCGPAVEGAKKQRRKKLSSAGKDGIPPIMKSKYRDPTSGQVTTTEVRASFMLMEATDIVNGTWGHELTHWIAKDATKFESRGQPTRYYVAQAGLDDDGDGVPNDWEIDMGMNPYDPITFKNFQGSGGGDQEAYAWLGTCLSDAAATRSCSLTINGQVKAPTYHGKLAPKSNEAVDWSVDGPVWDKSQ